MTINIRLVLKVAAALAVGGLGYLIRGRNGAVVGAERFGYAFKPGTPMLALYVDEPARFAGAVGAAVARQLPRYA